MTKKIFGKIPMFGRAQAAAPAASPAVALADPDLPRTPANPSGRGDKASEAEAMAALWVARLDGEQATELDRAAFESWCDASEENRVAAAKMSGLFGDMNQLRRR